MRCLQTEMKCVDSYSISELVNLFCLPKDKHLKVEKADVYIKTLHDKYSVARSMLVRPFSKFLEAFCKACAVQCQVLLSLY